MPRKIRERIHDRSEAGCDEIPGGGKGAHRQLTHTRYPGAVTLSGQTGEEAKASQEKQVRQAIERVKR